MAAFPTWVSDDDLRERDAAEIDEYIKEMSRRAPRPKPTPVPTTASLSNPVGGGAEAAGLRGRILDYARSRLGDEGARVIDAILETEGGLGGALGDSGRSHGPFQYYQGGGQFDNYAAALGLTPEQTGAAIARDPLGAARWGIDNYLGNAVRAGMGQGLSGADLATYAQQHGQVSVAPERAGQNYQRLYEQPSFVAGGTPTPTATPTPQPQLQAANSGFDDAGQELDAYISSLQRTRPTAAPTPAPTPTPTPTTSPLGRLSGSNEGTSPFVGTGPGGAPSDFLSGAQASSPLTDQTLRGIERRRAVQEVFSPSAAGQAADQWRYTALEQPVLGRGVGQVMEGAGRFLQWLGSEKGTSPAEELGLRMSPPSPQEEVVNEWLRQNVGRPIVQAGRQLEQAGKERVKAHTPPDAFEVTDETSIGQMLGDPRFYRDVVLPNVTQMGVLVPLSILAGRASPAVLQQAGLGSAAPIVRIVLTQLVRAVPEALMEGANRFGEAKAKGASDQEASGQADQVFRENVAAIAGFEGAELLTGARLLPKSVQATLGKEITGRLGGAARGLLDWLGGAFRQTVSEGAQELTQDWLQARASGESFNPLAPRGQAAFLAGGLMGLGGKVGEAAVGSRLARRLAPGATIEDVSPGQPGAGALPGTLPGVGPSFVTDSTRGKIARVVGWDVEGRPRVVFPGSMGGLHPTTNQPYEYILKEGQWRPTTASDFDQVRASRSDAAVMLRQWRDEYLAAAEREAREKAREAPIEPRQGEGEAKIGKGAKPRAATGLTKAQEEYLTGKLEEVAPTLPRSYPSKEGVRIQVPDDGSFTVYSQEQANRLHYTVTGQPIEGMMKPPGAVKASVESSQKSWGPESIQKESLADQAMRIYGHPLRAIPKLYRQIAYLEEVTPKDKWDPRIAELATAIDELERRAAGTTYVQEESRYGPPRGREVPYDLYQAMERMGVPPGLRMPADQAPAAVTPPQPPAESNQPPIVNQAARPQYTPPPGIPARVEVVRSRFDLNRWVLYSLDLNQTFGVMRDTFEEAAAAADAENRRLFEADESRRKWLEEEAAKRPTPPTRQKARTARPRVARSAPAPGAPPWAETDARLRAEIRDIESRRSQTHAQEVMLKVRKRQLAADPSRWQAGDGVAWNVTGNQINRGFRIVEVRPETKEVVIRQVADTGLTSTGGNDPLMGNQLVSLGDIKRDRKYDAPTGAPPPEGSVDWKAYAIERIGSQPAKMPQTPQEMYEYARGVLVTDALAQGNAATTSPRLTHKQRLAWQKVVRESETQHPEWKAEYEAKVSPPVQAETETGAEATGPAEAVGGEKPAPGSRRFSLGELIEAEIQRAEGRGEPADWDTARRVVIQGILTGYRSIQEAIEAADANPDAEYFTAYGLPFGADAIREAVAYRRGEPGAAEPPSTAPQPRPALGETQSQRHYAVGDLVRPTVNGIWVTQDPARVTDASEYQGEIWYAVEGTNIRFPEDQLEPAEEMRQEEPAPEPEAEAAPESEPEPEPTSASPSQPERPVLTDAQRAWVERYTAEFQKAGKPYKVWYNPIVMRDGPGGVVMIEHTDEAGEAHYTNTFRPKDKNANPGQLKPTPDWQVIQEWTPDGWEAKPANVKAEKPAREPKVRQPRKRVTPTPATPPVEPTDGTSPTAAVATEEEPVEPAGTPPPPPTPPGPAAPTGSGDEPPSGDRIEPGAASAGIKLVGTGRWNLPPDMAAQAIAAYTEARKGKERISWDEILNEGVPSLGITPEQLADKWRSAPRGEATAELMAVKLAVARNYEEMRRVREIIDREGTTTPPDEMGVHQARLADLTLQQAIFWDALNRRGGEAGRTLNSLRMGVRVEHARVLARQGEHLARFVRQVANEVGHDATSGNGKLNGKTVDHLKDLAEIIEHEVEKPTPDVRLSGAEGPIVALGDEYEGPTTTPTPEGENLDEEAVPLTVKKAANAIEKREGANRPNRKPRKPKEPKERPPTATEQEMELARQIAETNSALMAAREAESPDWQEIDSLEELRHQQIIKLDALIQENRAEAEAKRKARQVADEAVQENTEKDPLDRAAARIRATRHARIRGSEADLTLAEQVADLNERIVEARRVVTVPNTPEAAEQTEVSPDLVALQAERDQLLDELNEQIKEAIEKQRQDRELANAPSPTVEEVRRVLLQRAGKRLSALRGRGLQQEMAGYPGALAKSEKAIQRRIDRELAKDTIGTIRRIIQAGHVGYVYTSEQTGSRVKTNSRELADTLLRQLSTISSQADRAVHDYREAANMALAKRMLPKDATTEDIANAARELARLDMSDPRALGRFASALAQPGVLRHIHTFRLASMLSGPRTLLTDLLGTAFNVTTNVPTRFAAGLYDDTPIGRRRRGGRAPDATRRMAVAEAVGFLRALPVALDEWRTTYQTGFSTQPMRNVGNRNVYRADMLGGPLRPLNQVFRVLAATGDAASTIAEAGALEAFASLQAGREGKSAEYIKANLGEYPWIMELASRTGREAAFMGELKGIFRTINNLRGPEAVRLVIPMFETAGNIAQQGQTRTPWGFREAATYEQEALTRAKAQGESEPAIGTREWAAWLRGAAVLGTMVMAGSYLAGLAGLITAYGPGDDDERKDWADQGGRSFSFRVLGTDTWVSYVNLPGPWTIPMALGAALAEATRLGARRLTGPQHASTESLARRSAEMVAVFLAESVIRSLRLGLEMASLRGLSDFFKAIVGYGSTENRVENWAEGLVTSFVPYGGAAANLAQALDPEIKAPDGIVEAILARLPLLSREIQPQVTQLGETRKRGNQGLAAILPVQVSREKRDPVYAEYARLREAGFEIGIGNAGRSVRGIDLSPAEQASYARLAGQKSKEYVEKVMAAELYKKRDSLTQAKLLERAVERAREEAGVEYLRTFPREELRRRLLLKRQKVS